MASQCGRCPLCQDSAAPSIPASATANRSGRNSARPLIAVCSHQNSTVLTCPLPSFHCRNFMPGSADPSGRRNGVLLPDAPQHRDGADWRLATGGSQSEPCFHLGADIQRCPGRVHPGVTRGRPCPAPGRRHVVQCHGLLQSRDLRGTQGAAAGLLSDMSGRSTSSTVLYNKPLVQVHCVIMCGNGGFL